MEAFECDDKVVELTNGIFQAFASFESRNFHCRDLDFFAWVSRIDTRASGTFADSEGSESGDRHVLSLGEGFGDGFEDSLESHHGSFFGDASAVGSCIDEILFRHCDGG